MTDRPLRPVTDHRLGKPLPYQQANQTQTHLYPSEDFYNKLQHRVLATVSSSYPRDRGRLSTRYSPVRRCSEEPLTCMC